MKRCVLVKGNFGPGNFGDDALMIASRHLLRKAFGAGKIKYEGMIAYKDDEYNSNDIATDLERYLAATHIYDGGTQFFSFEYAQKKSNYLMRIKKIIYATLRPKLLLSKLVFLLIRALMPSSVGIKTILGIGLGFGPFIKASAEEANAQLLARKFDFLWVRDRLSYKFCKENGAEHVVEGPDLCFLPEFYKQLLETTIDIDAESRRIGVIVRDWRHSEEGAEYEEYIQNLVVSLRNNDFKVEYIVFEGKDISWIERLSNDKEEIILWQPEKMNIGQFIRILAGFEMFITARYHGAVFSVLLQKPFMAIDVEQKLVQVSSRYDKCSALWSRPYDVDVAVDKINELLNPESFVNNELKAALEKDTNMARMCEEQFLEFISKDSYVRE